MTARIELSDSIGRLTRAAAFLQGLGFAYPRGDFIEPPTVQFVEQSVLNVREQLAALEDGTTRTLMPGRLSTRSGRGLKIQTDRHDGGLVIVTYAELERLHDGLRRGADNMDKIEARATLAKIIGEFNAEADDYRYDEEIPF